MISPEEIGYQCEIQENMAIEDIRNEYRDGIIIWLNGSGQSPDGKKSRCRCVLDYSGRVKYLEKELLGATANQVMIMGAIDAVMCINKPFKIYLIIPTALGVASAFRGKGVNVELIYRLLEVIKEKGATLTEGQYINGGDIIKKFIYASNPDSSKRMEYEKQQEDKKIYKEVIYKECLAQVETVLLEKGVVDSIIGEVLMIRP